MPRVAPVLRALAFGACAAPPRASTFPARVFRSSRAHLRRVPVSPHATPAVALVERALHERGLRFGTDGTPAALFAYLRASGEPVSPAEARPGDVVFFAARDGAACGDHAGLVEAVDAAGRLTFREGRDGAVHHSFADPAHPLARRDADGRILNTFLRPRRPDDPPDARYFAGQMLCAVLRPPG